MHLLLKNNICIISVVSRRDKKPGTFGQNRHKNDRTFMILVLIFASLLQTPGKITISVFFIALHI
jgi:hypothetical protein